MYSPSALTVMAEITFWHWLILVYPCHPLDMRCFFLNTKGPNRPKGADVIYVLEHCSVPNRSLATNFPIIIHNVDVSVPL